MATKQSTPKVVTVITDEAVESLWNAGRNYVDTVATNDLAALNAAIDADIAAHAVFAPAYAIAQATWLADNVGGKYSAARFVSMLNGRVQKLHNDESDTIKVSDSAMSNLVAFTGDREYHDEMVEQYVIVAAKEGKSMTMPRYRKFLADWAADYYNEDGTRTQLGQDALNASGAAAAAAAQFKACGTDFEVNLEGQSTIQKLAWIDAALWDLENLRAKVAKNISAADKKSANQLVKAAKDSKGNLKVTLTPAS